MALVIIQKIQSFLTNETNKKVIGKMKDEFGGVIATEFVGLKPYVIIALLFYNKNW